MPRGARPLTGAYIIMYMYVNIYTYVCVYMFMYIYIIHVYIFLYRYRYRYIDVYIDRTLTYQCSDAPMRRGGRPLTGV